MTVPSPPNTAVVTGGSAGIGAAICREMVRQGYDVVSLARTKPDWSDPRLSFRKVDLLDAGATAEAAGEIGRSRAVTHLVHNAGAIRPSLLPDVKLTDLQALTQLHLGAAITLMQAVLPAMRAAKFGRIILMSSRAAVGMPTRTAYSATKAGMIGMAKTWALELASSGITVNAVAPGPVRTDMFHALVPKGSPQVETVARSIPVGRIGEPADVVRAVMFFADRDAGFITGQVLYVCGGASIGRPIE